MTRRSPSTTLSTQEFFATDNKGNFEHRTRSPSSLTLTTNEKYPFSTPELRNEIRHCSGCNRRFSNRVGALAA